jgi:3-oxoacyl-[acyl-carrier-protein] synthase II
MRRVVITGLGLVSPLGCGYETTWERLTSGQSATRRIESFDVADLSCQIACQVPRGDGSNGSFNPNDWMEPKEQRKVDEFIVYAMSAATQALQDAGWEPTAYEDQIRTGVLIGSGIGGLQGIEKTSLLFAEKGPRRVSPFFIPGRLINLAAGYVSIEHGLKGPNHAVVTACSTGAHAIGDASRLVALGDADVMLAGGSESPVCRLAIAGFAACRALSTNFNDQPERASRPYDRDRDGFVMGEGAGVVVLEELEHAKARGAHIYAEIIGYGLSGDAFHITAPAEDGDGAYRCMVAAVKRAGIDPADIDYINAHGTSTPMGDEIELSAVERLFGNAAGKVSMSSTKSAIGHLLGAAGAVEAIFSALAIRDAQSRQSFGGDGDRSGAAPGEAPHHRYGAVELVRIWRHQCLVDLAPLQCVTPSFENLPFAIFRLQVHGIVARGACWPCL